MRHAPNADKNAAKPVLSSSVLFSAVCRKNSMFFAVLGFTVVYCPTPAQTWLAPGLLPRLAEAQRLGDFRRHRGRS